MIHPRRTTWICDNVRLDMLDLSNVEGLYFKEIDLRGESIIMRTSNLETKLQGRTEGSSRHLGRKGLARNGALH